MRNPVNWTRLSATQWIRKLPSGACAIVTMCASRKYGTTYSATGYPADYCIGGSTAYADLGTHRKRDKAFAAADTWLDTPALQIATSTTPRSALTNGGE